VGTFHADAHPLHGITCVVETRGPRTWVGRVDRWTEEGLVLLDADLHEEGAAGPSRDAWLARVAAVGPWPRHPRAVVPAAEVVRATPLGAG
jgi:hypothetical protein